MLTLIREHPVWTAFVFVEVAVALWFAWEIRHALPAPEARGFHKLAPEPPEPRCATINPAGGVRPHPLPSQAASGAISASGAPLLALVARDDAEAVEALIRGRWAA